VRAISTHLLRDGVSKSPCTASSIYWERERLPVGPAGAFAERLCAFRDAGVQQVLVWPVTDEERQLELFCEQVIPLIAA
jgi:hypothetical protein